MRKVSFVGALRYLGGLLIVMQGVLFALLAILMLNDAYQEQWKEYGKGDDSITLYLSNISEEKSYEIEQYLYNEAESAHLFVIRRDSLLTDDGSFSGYIFGVYGDAENNGATLSFYGDKILNSEMLTALMQAEGNQATLGIDNGSAYSVGDIPCIQFGDRIVLKKLGALIEESGTIQGEYTIIGAEGSQGQKIVSDLADISGLSEEDLSKSMSGEDVDNGFRKIIVIVFILAQIMLNTIFFIIIMLRNLDKSGKLVLLGWSRSAFCYELFSSFLWFAITAVPFLTVFGVIWSGWTNISAAYISYFFLYSVLSLILIIVETGISAAVLMSVGALSAIRGRFPKKALYLLGILAYLGVSAGTVFCGLYVDSPVQMISENAKLSSYWQSVSDYQVLGSISVGNDESSFSGASNELNQNVYDWYKEIYDKDGVYLVQTSYYDESILELWKTIYTAVPENAFWYFTFSKSYIKKLGINVSDETLKAAEEGTRVYLIPSGMAEKEKKAMKLWLEEFSVSGIKDGDIDTVFNRNKEMEFVEYEYDSEFFTWAVSSTEESVCTMPVIYICTPENMTYFESESLRAVGFDGYIKFENKAAMKKYVSSELMERFGLNDNNLSFTDVQNYIDGLQKSLMSTIAWFGVVFLIFSVILIGILTALASVFRIANREKLNVQKFLGYGFLNMYAKPVVMLGIVIITEMAVMLCGGSRFGFAAMLLLAIVQLLIFTKYMTKNEIGSVRMAFKGE